MDPWIKYTYHRILARELKASEITMGFMPKRSYSGGYLVLDKVNDKYDRRHNIRSVTLQKFINTGADIDELRGNNND